jgi:uncharacterized glyoxalase superfamily protein PhnB
MNLSAVEMKAFAPASNFETSKQFYLALGFEIPWYAHVMATGVAETFGVAVGAPQDQPWGLRDFTLFDPSGVLWRIGQNISVGSD